MVKVIEPGGPNLSNHYDAVPSQAANPFLKSSLHCLLTGRAASIEADQEAEIATLPLCPGTRSLIGFPPFG